MSIFANMGRTGVWAGAVVIAGLLLALGMALGGCEDDVTDLDHLMDAGAAEN